jgi:hypothetical protein
MVEAIEIGEVQSTGMATGGMEWEKKRQRRQEKRTKSEDRQMQFLAYWRSA